MTTSHTAGVIGFYDTHPINEDEILAKLAARGDDIDTLTEETLKDFDQDHYGGIDVVDALAARAGITRAHRRTHTVIRARAHVVANAAPIGCYRRSLNKFRSIAIPIA